MKRTKRLPVLLTDEEHKIIKIQAIKMGISASNLVRISVNKFLDPDDAQKNLWKLKD